MKPKSTYYPINSIGFSKSLLIHMRPYLLFVSGVVGLSGMAIAPINDLNWLTFLFAFIPLFFGYGFGQALTDCFQTDTDSISSPYRPLSKKEVSPFAIGLMSALGLLLIALMLIIQNPYNIVWTTLSIAGLSTYTYFKRHFWYAGPAYNSLIVMLLPIMGYFALSKGSLALLSNPNLWFICGLSFFSYANFVLIGYLKDISADRKTGYNTFPVVFGWTPTIWLGNINLLFATTFCFILVGWQNPLSFSIFLSASIIGIFGQLKGHFTREKIESNASIPISCTVRSLLLWHLAVILHLHPEWLLFGIVFYALFELILYVRPRKDQI